MGENRPKGDIPPDEPSGEPRDTRRLTVREAAEELGVSEAAVRNRISRGTLQSMRESGTVYVLLEADEPAANRGESSDQSEDKPTDESRLIDVLHDQVQHLRGELEAEREARRREVEAEREARRRADHIIAALTERIPELEAPPQTPQEAQEAAESASEGENREEASEESMEAQERRVPWWRRIFGS